MDSSDVMYFIIGACVMFAAICAYAIYQHVQDERLQFYKYKFRNQIAQSEPLPTFDYKRKPTPTRKSREASDVRAIRAAPLAVAMVTEPEVLPGTPLVTPPPYTEPEAPPPPGPGLNTTQDPPQVLIATAGGVAAVAAVATVATVAAVNARPPRSPPASNNASPSHASKEQAKQPAPRVKKDKPKAVADFDDYRQGSPKHLPPPGDAPGPAHYSNPPEVKTTGSPRPLPVRGPPKDGLEF